MDEGTGVDRTPRVRWDGRVPKYDAFGREIGEDTLSGLGGSGATPQPAPQPAPAQWQQSAQAARPPVAEPPSRPPAQEPAFTAPGAGTFTPPQPRRRRRGGFGCLIGLVVLAAVVAGPVIALVSIVGDATDAIDDVTGVLDDPAVVVPEPGGEDAPPTGIAGRSMVREQNFAGAIRRIAGEELGRPVSIRLSPDRASMQMIKGTQLRPVVTVDFRGDFAPGPTVGIGSGPPTFPLAKVDPSAPARLVRAAAERYPALKPGRLNYLVASLDPTGGGHRWNAYYTGDGGYVAGDARGRVQGRVKP